MNPITNNILLSVIVPTYKRTDSLYRLLDCLKKQSIFENLELIVIDQNKPDYLKKDISSFCKILRLDPPNVSTARNIGAINSLGNWLLFIDDDLLPDNKFCETALNYLQSKPFIECLCPLVYNNLGKSFWHSSILNNLKRNIDFRLFEISETMSAALFINRNTFLLSGGFDEFLFDYSKTGEDQEFFLRLGKKGIKIYYSDIINVFHDDIHAGGCQLRTDDYWTVRKKCIKSWVFRYKIHSKYNQRLMLNDYWNLSRSAFLNFMSLKKGPFWTIKQIVLLFSTIKETNTHLLKLNSQYTSFDNINHLNKYITNTNET